jgi:mannose-6-phosphate isomerase-like protein (cupin superfamily)
MSQGEKFDKVRVIDSRGSCPDVRIVEGEGWAKAVIWPGNGALYRTFQIINLGAGSSTRSLDHETDSVYYVMRGAGVVEDVRGKTDESIVEGSMIHIDAGDTYRIRAGDAGLELLGGPCPADERWYSDATTN